MSLPSPSSTRRSQKQRPDSTAPLGDQNRFTPLPRPSRQPRSSPSMSTTALDYGASTTHLSQIPQPPHTTTRRPQGWIPSTNLQKIGELSGVSLVENIGNQYNDLAGEGDIPSPPGLSTSPSSFCYRHDPDTRCQRQADDPTMDNLQKVCEAADYSSLLMLTHIPCRTCLPSHQWNNKISVVSGRHFQQHHLVNGNSFSRVYWLNAVSHNSPFSPPLFVIFSRSTS